MSFEEFKKCIYNELKTDEESPIYGEDVDDKYTMYSDDLHSIDTIINSWIDAKLDVLIFINVLSFEYDSESHFFYFSKKLQAEVSLFELDETLLSDIIKKYYEAYEKAKKLEESILVLK